MKLGEINYNVKPDKPKIFLCKPDKKTIGRIHEAYDITYDKKLSVLNELSFKIPTVIVEDGVPMNNANIENIKHRYLFKLKYGHVTEYFLINNSDKSYNNDEYVQFTALSLGVQLSDKNIRSFEVVSKNLSEIVNEILSSVNTNWKLGYVDSYFENIFRSYEVSSNNILEIIYELANMWNALIVWDSINCTISFYKPESMGNNKGFFIRDGKYLESFNLSTNTIETITRLKAYGQDGLSIHRLNPTGQAYIEDYRYYMYPFQQKNGHVVNHSEYMSDALCIALENYQQLIESLSEQFANLTAAVTHQQAIVQTEEQKLSVLHTEKTIIENELDISNANFQSHTTEHANIIHRLELKRTQVSLQESFIRDLKYQLNDYANKLSILKTQLLRENNFSSDELKELSHFEIEKEYVNDAIIDEEDLLEEAKEVFRQYLEPKVKLDMSLVDFLSIVEAQNDWDKLGLGDVVSVRYDRLQVEIKTKITEIRHSFEDGSISLTISNEIDEKNTWLEQLNKAGSTSTLVQMEKWKWDLSKENNGAINDIINNKWDSLKNAIMAGYNQQIEISERGIIVKDLEDPLSWLVIQNGFLAITNDNGNSWKHAISKDGIFGERIFGKIISGVNLMIEDESGIWITRGSRTTIFNRQGDEVMRLGLVSDNQFDENGNLIPQDHECFGLVSWNNATRVALTTCEGFSVSKRDGSDWKKVLWANTDGTLYSRNMVAENIKVVNNLDKIILDAENNYFNIGLFDKIVADGKLTTLEKLDMIKELYKIHSDYKLLLQQAEKYIRSARDNYTDVEGAFDTFTRTFPTVHSTTDRYSTSALKNAYLQLLTYLSSYIKVINNGYLEAQNLLIDMTDPLTESTSIIENRGQFVQMFKNYYDEATRLRQAIEDSLFYSGIQMGRYHNNLIMNDFGFIAVRNDGKYRAYLNATNGLALQKWENNKWVSKLFATLGDPNWEDGTLYAEGLVTKNLRIVDGDLGDAITFDWMEGITIIGRNGEVIKLNANEAISIYVDGDRKFYVGTDGRLYAKDITTHNLKIVDGFLGEKIIFDQDEGITINGNNGQQIRLNANEGIAIDVSGDKRFWIGTDGMLYAKKLIVMDDLNDPIAIDGSFISDLTVNKLLTLNSSSPQDVVHIEDNYIKLKTQYSGEGSDTTKFKLHFNGSGTSAYPEMIWGAESGGELGKIYKDNNKFAFEYSPPNFQSKFLMNQTDTEGDGQAMLLQTTGGIRLDAQTRAVMRTGTNEYVRVVKGEDVAMKFGEATVMIKNGEILLSLNASTYIKLSSSGIEMKGAKIDLN
ncbi:phage tail protein [Metasolibacillus meyeri]|uniref:phage tail protein n=1 Tax=Metasolibacillus meyeri TaxID=1071052 RepID=UPI000D300814|nr:phage tail protein [Metasolibacillus meyeri]